MVEYEGMSTRRVGFGNCMNVKIGLGNISRCSEVGGRGGCIISAATNKDFSVKAFYCIVFIYLIHY
jgi:hypothetical protein